MDGPVHQDHNYGLLDGTAPSHATLIAGSDGEQSAPISSPQDQMRRRRSALPVVVSAVLLMAVAVAASVLSAARAARVDVMQALRSE